MWLKKQKKKRETEKDLGRPRGMLPQENFEILRFNGYFSAFWTFSRKFCKNFLTLYNSE